MCVRGKIVFCEGAVRKRTRGIYTCTQACTGTLATRTRVENLSFRERNRDQILCTPGQPYREEKISMA